MTRPLAIIAVVGLAGCFDFEALRRPLDSADLSSETDLSPALDLAAASDLASPNDLASTDNSDLSVAGDLAPPVDLVPPADLTPSPDLVPPCETVAIVPPAIYVSKSGSATGAGTIGDPVDTIDHGLELANALTAVPLSSPVSVVVAGGTYNERVSDALQRQINFVGGFDSTFTCRNRTVSETKIVGPSGQTAVFLIGAKVVFDGFTVVGGAPATSSDPVRTFNYSGPSLTLRDSSVLSHPSGTASSAVALEVWNSDFEIHRTSVTSGAAGSSGSVAVDICNSRGSILRSHLDANANLGNGIALQVRHFTTVAGDCGSSQRRGEVIVTSSVLRASGLTATALRGQPIAGESRSNLALTLRHTALVSDGSTDAQGLVLASSDASALAMASLDHVTVWANPNAVTSSTGILNIIDGSLDLKDSIVFAGLPLYSTVSSFALSVPSGSANYVVPDGPHQTTAVLRIAAMSFMLVTYQMMFDPGAVMIDPSLSSADHYHLTAGSPARGAASDCGPGSVDVDGESRPQPNAVSTCDVGADETP